MKIRPTPLQSQLRAALDYNPDTGIFIWKTRSDVGGAWNAKWAGKVAGMPRAKGVVIYFGWKPYCAHRLAWVYMHGDCLSVERQVDHRNCNPLDNRIDNLRLAAHGQNGSNTRGWAKKKLPKGVSIQPKSPGYRARIGVDGKVQYLGTFPTIEEAHAAYVQAAVAAKGEFARAA